MKTRLLFAFLFCVYITNVKSQTTAITDPNFEQALIDAGIDTNGLNGNILNTDALAVTELDVSQKNISNLTGIQAFTNLTNLFAFDNSITSVDLSSNTNLEQLGLSRNGTFTSLNVSMLGNLTRLFVDSLGLTSIDVSSNPNLTWLYANNNALSAVNTVSNTNLERLYVSGNNLTNSSLVFNTNLKRLSASQNRITSFDATPYTNMELLSLQEMQAGFSLTSINTTNLTSLLYLFVGQNALTTVDVSTNTALLRLGVNNMDSFTTLNVSSNLALQYLYAGQSNITGSFDLSNHPSLIFVDFYQNDVSGINIANGNNTNLANFYAAENTNLSCVTVDDINLAYNRNGDANFSWFIDNSIIYATDCNNLPTINVPDDGLEQALIDAGIDRSGVLDDTVLLAEALATRFIDANSRNISDQTGLENFVNLTGLNISTNPLNTFDTTPFTQLDYLDVYNTNISALDLSNTPNMKALYCAQNNINTLDITNLNLRELGCDNNNISNLNLVNSTDLERLYATNNQISTIDLSNAPNLQYIYVNDNPLGTLNFSAQTQLIEIGAGNTGISTIDVGNNPNLEKLFVYTNQLTNIVLNNNLNLKELDCNNNDINADLDLSNHTLLERVLFEGNELSGLNIKNGNTAAITELDTRSNPLLTCIQVDNVNDANTKVTNGQWQKSNGTLFNTDCTNQPTVYVPDNNLEQALIDSGIDSDGTLNDSILLANALGADFLDLNNRNISDPTGLEAFENLTGLNLSNNNLSVLNLNTLTKLEYLDVYNNNLNSLNLNATPSMRILYCAANNFTGLNTAALNLEQLGCNDNNIVSLNLDNSTNLQRLYATGNSLTGINLTNNTNLQYCHLSENPNLGTVDFSSQSQLIELTLGNTGITNLDPIVFGNPLQILSLYGNNLSAFNIDLINNNTTINTSLTELNLDGCNLTGLLNLSSYTNITKLFVTGNQIEGLNIQNGFNNLIVDHNFVNNSSMSCIQVDDVSYANANFISKDASTIYSLDCMYTLSLEDYTETINETTIYPNPTTHVLNIKTNEIISRIDVISVTGKVIKSINDNTKTVDLSDLQNGVYFVSIQTKNNIITKRVIKQ